MEDRFALLIDADNVSAKYIKPILDELSKYGNVTYKRIYGDWTKSNSASWKEELLQNNGEALLELVTRTDDICRACPHNQNGNCETYGKVNAYDAGVLAYCGLESGQKLSFHELEALVETRILHAGHGREICGDCEWSSICHKG